MHEYCSMEHLALKTNVSFLLIVAYYETRSGSLTRPERDNKLV